MSVPLLDGVVVLLCGLAVACTVYAAYLHGLDTGLRLGQRAVQVVLDQYDEGSPRQRLAFLRRTGRLRGRTVLLVRHRNREEDGHA